MYLHGIQKGRYYLIGADSGVGKCLGLGTRIIMFDGTLKKVEDVVVGDQLMGPDGSVRNVLSTTMGREQMYWIRQSRGLDYRVNKSHTLSLINTPKSRWSSTIKAGQSDVKKSLRKRSYTRVEKFDSTIANIAVTDYLVQPDKTRFQGWKASTIEFGNTELPLDPYFIGLWLGDGTRGKPEITTADEVVINYLYDLAQFMGLKVTPRGSYSYNIVAGRGKPLNTVIEGLRSLGIYNNKFVPKEVIQSSTQDKLAFIAGLIDSDGYYNAANGMVEITQKNRELSEGIVLVLRSLGFYVTIRDKLAKMKREDGTIYECNCYRVSFAHSRTIPCKLERKQSLTEGLDKSTSTRITVEKDTIDDYYGFAVDGDHLFLLEDFTVTHNSSVTDCIFLIEAWLAAKAAGKHIRVLYYSFEVSADEKIALWCSYLISRFREVELPTDYILGYMQDAMVTDEHVILIDEALVMVEEILQSVTIYDTPKNPTAILHDAITLAEELGEVKREKVVHRNKLDEKGKPKEDSYIVGYKQYDEDLTVLMMLDHAALTMPEAGLDIKRTIDRLSSYFVFIRNKFGFSPILIQQFNTEMQTVERRKFSQAAFAPQRSDFGDSRFSFRDADIAIGMIKPALFDLKSYYGYPIFAGGDQTMGLEDNFVATFLMKNRYGKANKMMPLFMNGISKRFFDLPLDPNSFELEEFAELTIQLKQLWE